MFSDGGEGIDEAVEEKPKKPVKPKRVVKNPQPKLNFEALQGAKGLLALNNLFSNFKFKGEKREKEDLAEIIKLLEQWTYRLYPKFHFEDALQRLESLGKKKIVQVYLRKIRNGMLDNDDIIHQIDDDDDDDNLNRNMDEGPIVQTSDDPFDELLSQQIQMQSSQSSQHSQNSQSNQNGENQVQLTQEQLERIERNKRQARERRLAKERTAMEVVNTDVDVDVNVGAVPRNESMDIEM